MISFTLQAFYLYYSIYRYRLPRNSIMGDYRVEGDIGVLKINNPPLNTFSYETRKALYDALQKAKKDHTIALVICGEGKSFSAGADVTEFDYAREKKFPALPQVCDAVENCGKPVVAAVSGYALGGGLELAIACHYRVGTANAKVGFPEVQLGILPAAGGTQRFPRLVPLSDAMEWISKGKHYRASAAAKIGVFDHIVPEGSDLVYEAIRFARSIATQPVKPVSSLPVKNAENAEKIAKKHLVSLNKRSRGQHAPLVCIEAVLSSTKLPFAEGLKEEQKLFQRLSSSGQTRALIYAFFAERQMPKWMIPRSNISWANSEAMPVKLGAVIGLGTMGKGIVLNFLRAGVPVVVMEMNEKFLNSGMQALWSMIDEMSKKQVITEKQSVMMKAGITGTLDYSDLKDADMVIEAVFEDIGIKEKVFRSLDKVCKPSSILATNTSALDVDLISSFTERPDKVMGMHFFAPAHLMKLLENVYGKKTSSQTVATCMAMGRKMGKVTVLVGNCPGFVGNRMYFNYVKESDFLLEEGAYPEGIDKAITDFGFAMGRYAVGDLSGNDVGYRMRLAAGLAAKQQPPGAKERERSGMRYCPLGDYLCEKGRFGRKSRKGWYDYPKQGRPQISEEVKRLIEEYRKRNGIEARNIDHQEIIERMLYPVINEGFKILDEGFAESPLSVDMVWLHGYAWPRHTGGPMFYAQTVGLPKLLARIRHYDQKFHGAVPYWAPSEMLIRLVEKYGNPPIQEWMACPRANQISSNL